MDSEEEARAFVAQLAEKITSAENNSGGESGAASAMDRIDRYCAMLCEENSRQNLVARGSLPIIWQRHIADSAQLLRHVSRETAHESKTDSEIDSPQIWLDLGSGAGLPGIIIAILAQKFEVVMVESRRKRIDWLERVMEELNLTNARVLGDRLENIESFPSCVISARAFAPLPRILDLSARFSTRQTQFLLPKGQSAAQELSSITKAEKNRYAPMFHVKQSLTDPQAGILVGNLKKGGWRG